MALVLFVRDMQTSFNSNLHWYGRTSGVFTLRNNYRLCLPKRFTFGTMRQEGRTTLELKLEKYGGIEPEADAVNFRRMGA